MYMPAYHKIPIVITQIVYTIVCFNYKNLPISLMVCIGAVEFPLAEYRSVLIVYRTVHVTEHFGCYSFLLKHHHFNATTPTCWCVIANIQHALATLCTDFPTENDHAAEVTDSIPCWRVGKFFSCLSDEIFCVSKTDLSASKKCRRNHLKPSLFSL